MTVLLKMIEAAEVLQQSLRRAGHPIDAAAAGIRIRALKDALQAIQEEQKRP